MPALTSIILSEQTQLDPAYRVLSIDIRREVNRIPTAELRVIDGSAVSREFAISNLSFFEPGAKIELRLRYEGSAEQSVFKGLVVRHGVEASVHGSVLVIGLKDVAVGLTGPRMSAVYSKKTDKAIIEQLISAGGATVGKVPKTPIEHIEMVQYRCTPWDFILSRADVLGLVVAVEDGAVSLAPMQVAGSAAAKIEYGIDKLYEIEIEADAGYQLGEVQGVAWDQKKQKPTPAQKAQRVAAAAGNLDGSKLAALVGNAQVTLSHPVPVEEGELKAWADARAARSRLALLRGRISMPGTAAIKQLDVVELGGVGRRFNGKALVTGIRHRVDLSGWRTDLQLGLSPEAFCRKPEISEAPAAGLLPGVSGLQIGVVAAFEEDKKDKLRVRVILPGVDVQKGAAVWAQLVSPDAGVGRGHYFRPEPGDEVVVGFLNDDPRRPVILGALYGAINKPPALMKPPAAANAYSGIVTKAGTKIVFVDDEKSSVYIETAKKARLLLDDGKKDGEEKITLTDKHGNAITMSKDGIEIKSKKKLVLNGGSAVEIKGQKVDIK